MLGALCWLALAKSPKVQIETVRNLSYERNDHRIKLRRLVGTRALFFQSKLSCDVDGSPNAYHPLNDDLALDVIESAGGRRVDGARSGALEIQPSPDVVVYVDGRPYIRPDGEFKGFYVSETSYQNQQMAATDSARYLDARRTQYIVLPGGLVPEAKVGDLAIVYDPVTHNHVSAIFGDIGPSSESGEAALATLQRLGMDATDGKSSPGQMRDDLFFMVFPGTVSKLEAAEGWPHPQATIDSLAESELQAWGGVDRIEEILKTDAQGGSVPDRADTGWIYDELGACRSDGLVHRYPFALPSRFGDRGRLPCAPEIAVAADDILNRIQRRIGAVETGRASSESLNGLDKHLTTISRIVDRFAVETGDEIDAPSHVLARILALRARVAAAQRV